MENGNKAEEHNGILVSTEMPDAMVMEIISRLPLKFVVQCKLLSKNIKGMISHPEFSKTLFQRQKDTSSQLIYLVNDGRLFRQFPKISLNPISQSVTTLSYDLEILASCNGLILFDFERIRRYCVFNPTTGEHQLIPYTESPRNDLEKTGLAVDYPNSDQYKLVTISKLVENFNLFYKFHLLSSEQSGLWREIQLRTNTFLSLPLGSPPVYWCDSLYWLRSDGSVLAFDTKREEAILIDRPEFLDHYDLSYGRILTGEDIWLGRAQGLLTLVCIFRKYIVFAAYDSASSRWRVSYTLDNFVLGPEGTIIGFPVWIDSKQVSFLVQRPPTWFHDLYEYDININGYENAAVLDTVDYPMYCFHPTLACVHKTPSNNVTAAQQEYIAAKLDDIRRFIIEGTKESSSSEEEAAAGGGGGGGEEEAAAGGGGGEEEGGGGGGGEEIL
ncbi:putative F-box protein At1g33530 [Solanum dulcamara]|uniref:putative F-box protein At1g33530 n=1 Tax=Solanum dulcamara TaxID=45834 RepID=UPI0024869311|nr:putative F-box protein At1g33530 [Solanum dulcamara]